jgi:DNA-binding transcriptional regulator YiaG
MTSPVIKLSAFLGPVAHRRRTPKTVRTKRTSGGGDVEAAELIRRRENLKMTRADLAAALGITQRAVRYYENGERPITQVIDLALRYLEIEHRMSKTTTKRRKA